MSMDYQQWLQWLMDDLGRGDIGVGNVEFSPPRLLFTLHKGRSTFDAWLPVAALSDRKHAMERLLDVVVRFNGTCWARTQWKADTQDQEAKYPERPMRVTAGSAR